MDLILVFQKLSEQVSNEKFKFSGAFSSKSSTARFNNSPFFPLACMLNELSNIMYSSFEAFLLSRDLKKGCAKAKIKNVSNNNRVAKSRYFFTLELFRV